MSDTQWHTWCHNSRSQKRAQGVQRKSKAKAPSKPRFSSWISSISPVMTWNMAFFHGKIVTFLMPSFTLKSKLSIGAAGQQCCCLARKPELKMPERPKHNTLKCNEIMEASHKHISMTQCTSSNSILNSKKSHRRPLSPSAWHGQTLALPVPSSGFNFWKRTNQKKQENQKQILVKNVNNTKLAYILYMFILVCVFSTIPYFRCHERDPLKHWLCVNSASKRRTSLNCRSSALVSKFAYASVPRPLQSG